MNGVNTEVRTSNEAITKLQEKRNAVGKTIIFLAVGAIFLVIPPVGIAILLFGCWRVQKLRKEMKGLYKDAFVREPLANNFDNVVYEPDNGFPEENVKNYQIFQMGNWYHSEDFIRATYRGVYFEVAEVKAIDVDKSSDSNYSQTFFEGRMLAFSFPNKLVTCVSAFSKKFKYRAMSKSEAKDTKVELESIAFNNAFDVYSHVQTDAFYLITPPFMERLQVLAGKYESIAMKVFGNTVVLAFNEPGKNVFDAEIEVGKLDLDKEMAKVQGEIDNIKMFITMILNLRTNV